MSSAQEIVDLASKIVSHSDIELKTNKHNQWFINAAKEAELDLEDDMLDDDIINKGDQKDRLTLREAQKAKQQLKVLLSRPMRTQAFGKFMSAGLQKSIQSEKEVKPYTVQTKVKKKMRKVKM